MSVYVYMCVCVSFISVSADFFCNLLLQSLRIHRLYSINILAFFSALGPHPYQSWRQPRTFAAKASVFFPVPFLRCSSSFLLFIKKKKYFLSCEPLIGNKQPSLCACVLRMNYCGMLLCLRLQSGSLQMAPRCTLLMMHISHPTATNSPDTHFLISPRPPCVCVCVCLGDSD